VTEREIAEAIQGPQCPRRSDALSELYGRLLRFLPFLAVGTSMAAAEDLLHELYKLLISALENSRIEDPDALLAYAWGMARKLRSRALEKQAERMRKVISIEPYLAAGAPDRSADPERELIDREEAAQLAAIFELLLAEMDPLDRRLVERFYLCGHNLAGIAADLGIAQDALNSRMYRLRKQLKRGYERIQRLSPDGGHAA
jgi:RNA polymerase sigma factor (sigma-70 family)